MLAWLLHIYLFQFWDDLKDGFWIDFAYASPGLGGPYSNMLQFANGSELALPFPNRLLHFVYAITSFYHITLFESIQNFLFWHALLVIDILLQIYTFFNLLTL